jgi:hypothetical protein
MVRANNGLPANPLVEFLTDAIADWLKHHRYAIGVNKDLANCGPDEVRALANDLGLSPTDFRELASKGPGAADLLKKMLVALKIDPKALNEIDQRVTCDLQRLCITCRVKRRCKNELAAGTAAKNMHEFCPNATSLETLFRRNDLSVAEANPFPR